MKLLFDQKLSPRLVIILATEFPASAHVGTVHLDTATDREIWDHTAEHDYVIASKDSDFRQPAFLHGPPPKVLWLRAGTVSTRTIADLLRTHCAPVHGLSRRRVEDPTTDGRSPG